MLLNRYDSAYHYYQEAISFARQLENESYERYIIRQLCLHARLTGNRQQAKAYLQEIVDTYGNDFYNKAVLFKEEGNADSASFYFLKATKIPKSLPVPCRFITCSNYTESTSRLGLRLCRFFPYL